MNKVSVNKGASAWYQGHMVKKRVKFNLKHTLRKNAIMSSKYTITNKIYNIRIIYAQIPHNKKEICNITNNNKYNQYNNNNNNN